MSNVLKIIPEFSQEGDERTRHAEPPDDEEHEQLDGLQGLVRAPQPLEGEVGLGVHVGVQDLGGGDSQMMIVFIWGAGQFLIKVREVA